VESYLVLGEGFKVCFKLVGSFFGLRRIPVFLPLAKCILKFLGLFLFFYLFFDFFVSSSGGLFGFRWGI
jgi:hypothetical protein